MFDTLALAILSGAIIALILTWPRKRSYTAHDRPFLSGELTEYRAED